MAAVEKQLMAVARVPVIKPDNLDTHVVHLDIVLSARRRRREAFVLTPRLDRI
jgi:hypothetical protein